jgi:hypothetical protein
MGWDFTKGSTKREIVAEVLAEYRNSEGVASRVIAHREVNKPGETPVLYVVREFFSEALQKRVGGYIEVVLLDKQTKSKVCDWSGWGYKRMGEDEHPYYYDCPLEFLDLIPTDNASALDWRDRVRQAQK